MYSKNPIQTLVEMQEISKAINQIVEVVLFESLIFTQTIFHSPILQFFKNSSKILFNFFKILKSIDQNEIKSF